jgi:tetratricopeptide (TPR) repeat protein
MNESVPQEEASGANEDKRCVHCKLKNYDPSRDTKICEDCRQVFMKYPIPKWIWLFAGAILLIMFVSMIRMPRYLNAAIFLSQAEKAMEAKRYVTAQKKLEKAIIAFPQNLEINARLMIAGGRNLDFKAFNIGYHFVINKKISDNDLLKELEETMVFVQSFFPSDRLLRSKIDQANDSSDLLIKMFDSLEINKNNDVLLAGVFISNKLYDANNYSEAEMLLARVLKIDPTNYPALSLSSAVKRNIGKYDEALADCDKMLAMNKEDVGSIAQKCRIELKRKHDESAAVYAKEAMSVDSESISAMEAQAMVDFYANRKSESLKLLATIRQNEDGDTTISDRLQSIINGTLVYR